MSNDPIRTAGQPDARSLAATARAYAEVAMMAAVSTIAGLLMAPHWGTAPVDLLYLPVVLAAASLYGLRPALFAAVAAALAYTYFFTAPFHTFRIDRPADLVTVAILFVVALVTSQLAARMREQARLAVANAARNATIAGLARRLISASSLPAIGEIACGEIASIFGCNAMLVVGREAKVEIVAASPGSGTPTPSDLAAAAVTLETGEAAGRGTTRLDPAEWLFRPVRAQAGVLAAIGLARDDGRQAVPDERLDQLFNLIDQVALAIERTALEAEAREVEGLRERDRLRGALLSSVGHDLRTPLTAILAATAALNGDPHDRELAATIKTEAGKLERYIANLLDMARIEAGAIRVRQEPVDLVDAVAAAAADLREALRGHDLGIDLPADLPLVRADPRLLHHVLINLIDNAAAHGGAGLPIGIAGSVTPAGGVRLAIADGGPGLGGAGERVFDTFFRLEGSDRAGGTGLGLAIVKAFAEAMQIGVEAEDRATGGALFTLDFPPESIVDEAAFGQEAQDTGR